MKKVCFFLMVLLIVTAFVSANGSQETETDQSITFWTFGTETSELKAVMEELKAGFKEKTGIDVEWKMIGWGDYHQSNLLVISSNEGPDVTQIGTTTVAQQTLAGAFEELDALFNELGGSDVFFKPMLATTSPQSLDGIYAIPWFADPRGMIYRKDVLDSLGLDVPKTWDEMVEVSKAIQDAGVMEFPVGIPGSAMAHDLYQTIDQAGGSVATYNGDKTVSQIDSKASVKGISWLMDLVTTYKVASPATAEYDKATLRAKFANGEIAFYYDSPQAFTYLAENAPKLVENGLERVSVAAAPAGPSGNASVFCGGSHLAIYKFTKNRENAEKWIKYLLEPKNVARWSKAYGNVPALLAASDLEGFGQEPWRSFISIAEKHGHHPESGPGGTLVKVEKILSNKVLGAYLQGNYTPELIDSAIAEGKMVHQRMIDQFE